MLTLIWIIALLGGVGVVVWGAEFFAEHLGAAAVALGVSSFALALLLAGAEPKNSLPQLLHPFAAPLASPWET